jgi:hypothetical protein
MAFGVCDCAENDIITKDSRSARVADLRGICRDGIEICLR